MGGMKKMDMKDSPDSPPGMKMKKRGMGMMGMMGEMGMMQGMDDMDSMDDGMDGMAMPSALPGFPGASHLYHIGATGFFLNHGEHIELTTEQQTKLNELKEAALLAKATSERKAAEAEQELWKLTSSGEPDAKMIEEKVREIEKIRGDQRLDFIRAVGEAAGVLTHEQHQALTGKHSSPEEPSDPATDHSKHNKD
jgi:Spy/CpxP family protein refolding chaperone